MANGLTRAEQARENGKKGGRPPGRKSAATLEREAIQRAFDQRVMRAADMLFNAQLASAVGVTMLYKRPKGGGRVVQVTSPVAIRRFLDQHGPAAEVEQDDGTYYFLAAEKPNAEAADRLLNRGLGKPVDHVKVNGERPDRVQILHIAWDDDEPSSPSALPPAQSPALELVPTGGVHSVARR